MTSIKKHLKITFNNLRYFIIFFISLYSLISYKSIAQESNKLNEIEINRIMNLDEEDNLDLPTNPFEIVDRIRRANSMNDATKPSVAIDDAIKSFDMFNENK